MLFRNYNFRISEHNALDCTYLELVPQLYRSVLNKVKKKIPCKGTNKAVHCSGPANILLQMHVSELTVFFFAIEVFNISIKILKCALASRKSKQGNLLLNLQMYNCFINFF